MGFKSLTARTILAFAALDTFFNPLVIASFLQILGVGIAYPAVPVMAVMLVLKIVSCAMYVRSQLRPYEAFAVAKPSDRTKEMVIRADECLQSAVSRVGVFYGTSWGLAYGLGYLVLRSPIGDRLYLSSGSTEATLLAVAGVWLGGFAFGLPLIAMLTAPVSGECSTQARQLGIALPRAPESLQVRIGVIALALGLGPTVYSIALGYNKQMDAQELYNRTHAEQFVARLVERVEPTLAETDVRKAVVELQGTIPGVELAVLDRRGNSLLRDRDGETVMPAYASKVLERAKNAPKNVLRISGQSERIAYQRLETGAVAVAKVDVPSNSGGYVLSATLFAIVIGLWAPISALILGRAITTPLERLITTTERIVEEGNQSELSALPVVRNDEVGRLSNRFNDLLDMMRDLSRAADAIAGGELRVELARRGELPDAFRRMLDSLRGMVREIRGTSVDLASAATEILAASQEQESAAASQSSAMEEISRTMESLSASAAHVSDSVQGVLANAEQTLSTADRMVARITELSGHANRIGEILDVIREIADRSDLLALNGSLEAS